MEPKNLSNSETNLTSSETNKTLLVLRGIPGSGKTSLAKAISLTNGAPIFSIDSYFENELGEYHFDYQKNHLAYKDCEAKTKKALEDKIPFVIVDNTFTLDWELEPYIRLANEFGYKLHVVTVENRHGGKNVHQIPGEQIEKMKSKYQVVL
ncbi:ATP-binding protein [Leptospira sp. 2 VSF19]|uniref:ATP-binding protein n=1 Tax=Leptospira soteropolitanensis TaxID=2950025 RepID=A0AAW5VFC6_9LEPT|nr:AAA family ATPase [Leptospira soteropolitanensis]MCW7491217.1 ATP-binding protein [Leptospira soteropolitanensis]MCW7498801.1 ATP-binding protein [Leptospira soteropolitanensis]MCW7521606.1 ATP-binding protein [Leptospira soteropolitanensis]MCW7524905.1 ATP-binding protein [Leptospira soteropolitanensis]MCW7528772.1 ATP-binding protein [Leptospira soteropolitanensis]